MKKSESNAALTSKHVIGYALGDFGGCMTFSIMGSFLTRYYVNVALIDTAVIAMLTLIWKICDALSNPIMGTLLDKSFAKSQDARGKFRPWMLRAAPLLAITAILVFTAPNLVDGAGRLVVVFVSYLCYELAYSMFNIPFGSLLSAMSGNDEERAKLSSARGIGGMMGNIIPITAFPIVIAAFEQNPALGYAGGITVCAVIGFICCLLSYRLTEERNTSVSNANAEPTKFTDILVVFRKNRAFVALCIHGLCQCGLQSITSALGTYMYSDVLGNIAFMSINSIAYLPVNLLMLVMAPKLSKKLGLERMIRISLLLSAGVYVFLFGLHLTMDVNVWLHIILSTIAFSLAGVSGMMQWGLLGEAIDYNEYLTGKRTEGSIYGTFNMLRRLGQAIATSLSVAMLGLVGYDAAASNMGLAQSAGTILGIKALYILVPAVLAMGSWAAFKFVWNITPEIRQKMAQAK